MTHIADALADVIPDVGYLVGGRAALEIDEDGRDAGTRIAAQVIEVRGFLQLALGPLGDLLQRVFDRSTRRSEEHTSELQSLRHLVCRLLLEKKKSSQLVT